LGQSRHVRNRIADVRTAPQSVRERRFTRPRIRICFQNARLQSFTLQVFEITVGQQFRMERSDNRDKARRSLNSPGFASLHPGYDAQSGLRWV